MAAGSSGTGPFIFGGNHAAAAAMSALHAAASSCMTEANVPVQSFYAHPGFQTQMTNDKLKQMHSQPSGTPFGINDILGRSKNTRRNMDSLSSPTPNYGQVITNNSHSAAMAHAAAAAAIYLGSGDLSNGSVVGLSNNVGLSTGTQYPKPLAELPGRSPIYWPGILQEDWRDKLARGIKRLLFFLYNSLLSNFLFNFYCLDWIMYGSIR